MVAIETKREFLRLLREDAEFKDEVRRLILTEDLLAMPKELKKQSARMGNLEGRVGNLEQGMGQLVGRVGSLEGRMDRVENDLGIIKGDVLELKMARNIVSIMSTKLNLRRGTLVKGGGDTSTPAHDFDDALYDAFADNAITDEERGRVNDTDAVIRAMCRKTGLRTYVAVEASFVIDDDDVDRANRTSEILSKVFPGDLTSAAVYGESINAEGSDMAEKLGVAVHLRG